MKWGLFGGTFDPIHIGHLRCAEEVREMLGLDKVLFVPAASPPLKRSRITPYTGRRKMVELALAENPAFEVSDIEGRRKGRSYSVDTVRWILENNPKSSLELHFILGQDAFQDIRRWKNWQELLTLCNFAVMTRTGYERQQLDDILPPGFAGRYWYSRGAFRSVPGTAIRFLPVTFLDISSTEIRKRLARGKSVRYLVPEPVLDYISRESLYAPRRLK